MAASIFHRQDANLFGFHSDKMSNPNFICRRNINSISTDDWNVTVALGWFPIIGGIIAGISHIMMGLKLNDSKLIGRGIAEIACLGPLLFLIDVIVTIGRMCTKPPPLLSTNRLFEIK